MALASLEIYKILPGTNCGDCGHPTCLSFVNDLVFRGEKPARCPHLNRASQQKIEDLVRKGSPRNLQSYGQVMFHPLETAIKRVQPLNFSYLSAVMGEGTTYLSDEVAIRMPFLNSHLHVTKTRVASEDLTPLPPGFQTAVFNYLATVAKIHPENRWVSFKELPGAVFLSSYFTNNVEGLVAGQFASRIDRLLQASVSLGGEVLTDPGISPADVKVSFFVVPKVTVRLLFWDRTEEDNLPAVATFLFDAGIYRLDLESLTHLIEELVKRLVATL